MCWGSSISIILCFIIISTWPAPRISAATVTHLPGFLGGSPLPFHLKTGYVEVDEVQGVELFYYFIESERNPRDDPVLLWLTGGPGCSSFNSLVLEIGFQHHLLGLTDWNRLLFLSRHPHGYESGDKSWAKHAEIFLRKWLVDHQEFQSNPLYIAGDSYAAKVVPLVLHYILNDNGRESGDLPTLNIQGTVREWVRCNFDVMYTNDISNSIPYIADLTSRGYPALVYSGDHDLTIPFVGTREWVRSLEFFNIEEWRSWHVGGQVAGYTVSYSNNLTFATVKGAGHTAPEYKPRECLAMFRRWSSRRSL